MLALADRPIGDVLSVLGAHGLSAAVIVPTPTGLEKSILDAIAPLRAYLKERGVHDFERQAQGRNGKVIVPAVFVYSDREVPTTVSLYRPETKSGDPRIWISGLPRYAKPGNVIAVIEDSGTLYVVNGSNARILRSVEQGGSPLAALASRLSRDISSTARELLGQLRMVCQRGLVYSVRRGDTGIGATLESLLGIRSNSRRAPDYKGIEIKAARTGRGPGNRVNLFSQVPDWKRSRLKSGTEILNELGYQVAGRRQLYCTVNNKPNPQGLFFQVDPDSGLLLNRVEATEGPGRDVAVWDLSNLREQLLAKHGETMWVKASSRRSPDGRETFHFESVVHTRHPMANSLPVLLGDGTVSMDYTLSALASGRARDHGYLFKIRPDRITALFPQPVVHDLSREA